MNSLSKRTEFHLKKRLESISLNNGNKSTLASIIGSNQKTLTEWESFNLMHPPKSEGSLPAQFYKMFWGTSMADEEEEWHDEQPPMPAEGAGLEENEFQAAGGEVGEPMDEGVSEEDESDDDIIEGCNFLEIDIEDFWFPVIWIRAEYIRIYDALEAYYRKPVVNPILAPAIVITGQPGIGKSVFIYYAIRRRLAEKKPFIWYFRETRYLFVEEGVYEVPHKFHNFKVFVWTFVDSKNGAQDGVPKNLVVQATHHFVIYCTSPNRERWSRLHKSVSVCDIIMNPWKRKEILRLASVYPDTTLREKANRVFDELGPIPRICIDYSGSDRQIEQYRREVRVALSQVTTSQIRVDELFRASCALAGNQVSDKLCLISREKKEDLYSSAVVSSITTSINSRLSNHLRTLARAEQIILYYKQFDNLPESRVMTGLLFEAMGLGCLQDGMTLELVPMVQLPQSLNQGGNRPQWYSSHILLCNESLEEARQLALQEQRSLNIPPGLDVVEYTDNGPSSITPGVIYLPELNNEVVFDSFILMNDLLYIFQFSIGNLKEHDIIVDIKPRLLDFMHKSPRFPSMDKWRFVFVHPPNHTLIFPQPRNLELRKLHPLSAKLGLFTHFAALDWLR